MQYLLASAFWGLFYKMGGKTTKPLATLADLIVMTKAAAKAKGFARAPINKLTLEMFKGKKNCKMKTKAAEGRELLKCVVFILKEFLPAQTPHDELRLNCVSALLEMYDYLELWLIGRSTGKIAAAHGRRSLMLYCELLMAELNGKHWQYSGWLVWRLYPNMHLLLHCLEDQVSVAGNPRESWCYVDESEIGAAVNVAESVHPSTLHRAVMEKHRLS